MKFAWSHSRLNTMRRCGYKFYLSVVKKIKPDFTLQPKVMTLGLNLHEIIQKISEDSWKLAQETGNYDIEISDMALIDYCYPYAEYFGEDYAWVFNRLKKFRDKFKLKPNTINYFEKKICLDRQYRLVEWFDMNNAFFRVVYDREQIEEIDNQVIITLTDYKSGSKSSTIEEQFFIYAFSDYVQYMVNSKIPNNLRIKVVESYLGKTGEEKEKEISFSEALSQFKEIAKEISSFESNPRFEATDKEEICKDCEFRIDCTHSKYRKA